MSRLTSAGSHEQKKSTSNFAVARATLIAGGSFASSVATILGVAGKWQLDDRTTLWALGALCVIVALTMFLVAFLMYPRP
jgi:hypothetical protein